MSYLMREGEFVETLKMRAPPEGSYDYGVLVEFLKLYRDAVQPLLTRSGT
ncbi:MAG: hypothetical protein QW154_07520 [Sulfolobales archaeon]